GYELQQERAAIAALTGTIPVLNGVEWGIVTGVNDTSPSTNFSLQNPYAFYSSRGIGVDLPGLSENLQLLWAEDGNRRAYNAGHAVGYIASWLESSTLEEVTNTQAMSTLKGFKLAKAQGAGIDSFYASNDNSESSAVNQLFGTDVQANPSMS